MSADKQRRPRRGVNNGRMGPPMVEDPALDAALADVAQGWPVADAAAKHGLTEGRRRTLYRRAKSIGAPGRPAAPPPPAVTSSSGQKLVKVAPAAKAPPVPPATPSPSPPPPPSEPDPTVAEIEALDTCEEAESIYRDIKSKLGNADPVRYASLAEKALAALNRIEQIKARRPQVVGPDEMTRKLVEAKAPAVKRIGLLTSDAAAAFITARQDFDAWCASLGSFGAEVKARVDAMLGGPTK